MVMRYAIIADIHGNLEAFRAVLADIGHSGGVSQYWCLGDTVGYGPEPHACLGLLKTLPHVSVAGNHDWAVAGRIGMAEFNPDAAVVCSWTVEQLSPEDIDYLHGLPGTLNKGDFTLVHGSPREPIWEYLLSASLAGVNMSFLKTPYCLVGHTHAPMVFREAEDGGAEASTLQPGVGLMLGRNRLFINPGAVGQSRDGNPEAAYAIYDSDTGLIQEHRVPYDVEVTQRKILDAGLPLRLATRLLSGT